MLSGELDVGDLPVFSDESAKESGVPVVAVEDGHPENGIIRKVVSSKTPKHFSGLSAVVPSYKGAAQLDRKTRGRAVSYMRANRRTEQSNPEEYMSMDVASGTAELSSRKLGLGASREDVASDVRAFMDYFEGFSLFRGQEEKLARDYFAFWGWLWFGPLLCDLRNGAIARGEEAYDYPVFGILYGKSNCGKSELVNTLLRSMFGRAGTTPTAWFTTNKVANLMEENRRYPLVFDDLERKRYSDYAISLIKEDHVRLAEYPPVVLSMNTTTQDAFETEVKKRSFLIYTGASLPDDDPETRELGKTVKRVKCELTTALYREYLKRVMASVRKEFPAEFLALSSEVLVDLISEYSPDELPEWCQPVSMAPHRSARHDKVREDLRQLLAFDPEFWERRGERLVLKMPGNNAANRLRRDVPDCLLSSGNVSNLMVFDAGLLDTFLGEGSPTSRKGRWSLLRRLRGRE